MIKKIIYVLIVFLTAFVSVQPAVGQDDDCNKTKVAVSVEIVDDTKNYRFLEDDFGPRPNSEWNGFVTDMLVEVLSEYEPAITFFALSEGGGDYHYHFSSNLDLTIVEVEDNEQTGYRIVSNLTGKSNCVPIRMNELGSNAASARGLRQAMMNLVSFYWPMDRNITQHEKENPSPPRDPELNIQIEKDFISPLDKESRITEVYAKVYDCRGHQVCDKRGQGQPVYYQDKIDRLDLKNRCCEGLQIRDFKAIVTNKECENYGQYKLKKGVDAEKKNIRFKTCRLGSGPLIVEEKELIIRGLKIEVKPDRKEIHPDQHTDIVITFSETEPDGAKHPVAGKDIQVKVTGLENGKIKARDGYTTDSEGKAVLDYKAGDRDEKITVRAWFEPPDYPDKAEGNASVTVKPGDYDATLTLERTWTKEIKVKKGESSSEGKCRSFTEMEHYFKESISASISLTLKLQRSVVMPLDNNRWQYYEVKSAYLSRFDLSSTNDQHRNGAYGGAGCAKGGYETNEKTVKVLKDRDLSGKEYVNKAVWIIVFDQKTGKALKLIPAGYGVDYTYDEIYSVDSRVWSGDDVNKDSKTETKAKRKDFAVGPVGEEIDDPTVKPTGQSIQEYLKSMGVKVPAGVKIPNIDNTQAVKKIPPGILVSYGDGKTSFGGRDEKKDHEEIDGGYKDEQSAFSWNMTRKKRNQ